ncbi:lytic transglycosylase domain-containing protein [Streptomyces sp. NPDC002004]
MSGDAPYRMELPPLRAAQGRAGGGPASGSSADGTAPAGGAVPASVFAAYRQAESELARRAPGCHLHWQVLAAVGQVESGQARGGRVSADGTTRAPILGPRLDGNGFAAVRDSDGGAYDGDTVYDRAVGPMQFIPSTWAVWGSDGNHDGRADPNNVYDAALAAGRYLCADGRDLSRPADLDRAILGYNHSDAYLRTVRAWYAYFLAGHRVVPDGASAAGPERNPEPEPEVSRATRPAPTPSPTRKAPSRPRRDASSTPASPSPSPSRTGPAGTIEVPVAPAVTLPGTGVELSVGGDGAARSGSASVVHPSPTTAGTGNGTDSTPSSPSTIVATQR